MGPAAAIGVGATVGAIAPFISKGISSLFGLDEPTEEERSARARREDSIRRLTEAAEGRTASAAQLEAQYQRNRTVQALAGMAQQGTVQQRAGNVRAAMQATPEVMAQQGAIAARTRADEMARAREALANAQMGIASAEAAAGERRRAENRALIGSALTGAAQGGMMGLYASQQPSGQPTTQDATGTGEQAQTATGPTQATTLNLGSPGEQQALTAGASPVSLGPSMGPAKAPSLNLGGATRFESFNPYKAFKLEGFGR